MFKRTDGVTVCGKLCKTSDAGPRSWRTERAAWGSLLDKWRRRDGKDARVQRLRGVLRRSGPHSMAASDGEEEEGGGDRPATTEEFPAEE